MHATPESRENNVMLHSQLRGGHECLSGLIKLRCGLALDDQSHQPFDDFPVPAIAATNNGYPFVRHWVKLPDITLRSVIFCLKTDHGPCSRKNRS